MSRSLQPISDAYRVVWRWHFYAGLLVMPVLLILSLTGGLYLFKPEIEAALYRSELTVAPSGPRASPERWVEAAEAAVDGRAASISVSDRADRAVVVKVSTQGGERSVFVDPYTARVTGSIPGDGLMGTVKRLHSLELFGRPFNILVEIVAGWAVILVATGIFLWWPRRRDVAVAAPRPGDPRRRPFWRDLHAVTGLYAGLIIAFLAVTGMPWSAVWGDKFLGLVRDTGLGRPEAPPAASPFVHVGPHDAPHGAGWTMEGVALQGTQRGARPLSLVADAVGAHELPAPYTISIPADPTLAYTVTRLTEQAEDARSLYVDGGTGAVIADIRWSQFGGGANAFEWGIAVHQGLQYGQVNRFVMLGGCIAVWLLAISGAIMWWTRRPARGLGAPPAPPPPRARAAVLGIVLPLAIVYPLTGLSLLVVIGIDAVARKIRNLRETGQG